jgi:hypothetical protein
VNTKIKAVQEFFVKSVQGVFFWACGTGALLAIGAFVEWLPKFWQHALSAAFFTYLKGAAIFTVYYFAKFLTADSRSAKPALWERAYRYGGGTACIAFIGGAFANYVNNSKGAEVFVMLLPAVLFGVTDGFTAPKPQRVTSSDSEM